jgi:hypothetical protein
MRITIAIAAVLFAVFALATPASAASPHFKNFRDPVFTDRGLVLNATGALAGLGEGDLTVVLTAHGVASVECTNHGGNVAPGQDTSVTTSGTVSGIEVKNGNASFSVTTDAPVVSNDLCPNPLWSAAAVDVDFSSATLDFFQGGVLVLSASFPV